MTVLYFSHMASKKPSEIAQLSKTVERGFAALAEDIAGIKETMATKNGIAEIKRTMATKEQLAALGTQVTGIERELKSTRRELLDLMDKFDNVIGYRKEIDHALERIAAIEKHLGLDKNLAA